MSDSWLNQKRLVMVQYWIRSLNNIKRLSVWTTTVSGWCLSCLTVGMLLGMMLTSFGSIQYKIKGSALLPYTALSGYPTTLPALTTRLSAFNAKTSVFERFKRIFVAYGVCVSIERVILPCKGSVMYTGIQSGSMRKSQFNPFSQNVKGNTVKFVQNSGFFVGFVDYLCVLCAFYAGAYYVQENKPIVSIASA